MAYFSATDKSYSVQSYYETCHQAITPQVLWGIKREQFSTCMASTCLCITAEIMHQFAWCWLDYLHSTRMSYCRQPTALLFSFLRVHEMTIPNQNAYNSSVYLSLQGVALYSRTTPTIVWLTIKQWMMDPFCKRVKFCVGCTNSVICPVKALLTFVEVHLVICPFQKIKHN